MKRSSGSAKPRRSPIAVTNSSVRGRARAGMTEYELVAEVEGYVKEHGAEDNFMLVASGGTRETAMKPPTARTLRVG